MTREVGSHTGPLAAVRRPRRFRSLASRLVVLGLIQLILLACTAAGIFIAEGPHQEAIPEDKITPETLFRLEQLSGAPAALSEALDVLHGERIEISVYDEARQLIASNVDPPLAVPPRPPRHGHRPAPDAPDRATDRAPHSARPPADSDPGDPPPSHSDSAAHPPDGDPGAHLGDPPPSPPLHGDSAARPPDGDPGAHLGDPPPPSPPLHGDSAARPPDGDPAAHLGAPPPPPPTPSGDAAPHAGEREPGMHPQEPADWGGVRSAHRFVRRPLVLPFHIRGGRGILIARGVHGAPPGMTGPLLVLVCGFLILVIGALITARWIVRPVERLSRTARALGSGDLTARSKLDRPDEIGELGHRFDEMADRIAGLLATEKELLANVAHELRTPLTRIGVALDLASEGDAEAARASLAEIAVDVSELETIVDDILTAMRFELAPGEGPAQLPMRPVTLPAGEIAVAAADRLRARHPERPLELAVADDAPDIHVDPMLFRRVIDNLLENAHKYTPDTGAPIRLAVVRDASGGSAVFEVSDRGLGIAAHDLPRIFTAFFRGERSRSRETGGVGLGLTLARRIVEAHGGTIDVTSAPNVGTTVRVAIPA